MLPFYFPDSWIPFVFFYSVLLLCCCCQHPLLFFSQFLQLSLTFCLFIGSLFISSFMKVVQVCTLFITISAAVSPSQLLAIQWCKPHLILLPLDLSDAMCTLGNFISFWIVDSECIFNLLGWCLRGGFESHFPFTSV
jgi:hypothetical protein